MTSPAKPALALAGVAMVVVALAVAGPRLTSDGGEAPAPPEAGSGSLRPAGGPVLTSLGFAAPPRPAPVSLPAAIARARREVGGVPQSDLELGNPSAPITITEYADLRCAECAIVHRDVVPELIRRHVRSGRVLLQLRQLPLFGSRSKALARAAFAAGRQDRYWEFVQLAYLQGRKRESGGAQVPRRLAAGLRLDVPRWEADRRRREWDSRLEAAFSVATATRLPALPVFLVQADGGPLTLVVQPESIADFERGIEVARRPPIACSPC